MVNNQTLGVVLILAAVAVVLFATPQGQDFLDDIGGGSSSKQRIECSGTIDKDSVKEDFACYQISGSCGFFAFQPFAFWDGLIEDEVSLAITYAGTVYGHEDYTVSSFGIDIEDASVDACVPVEASSVRLQLADNNGIKAQRVVNI